ncbi:cytosolic phospholipase A2 gamma-like [Tautogolabrus adspersus]
MEKDGLLDSVLYLGGVSGSTWSMASLYSDPGWSVEMDRIVSSLTGPGVEKDEVLSWLDEQLKEEDFSLTDIWGALISSTIMKKMDLRLLSDEASRSATNPYPIYCAVEKYFASEGPVDGMWFEVSPHEAGFTDLGLFIETSLLGSKFENGTLQEEKAEMDMVKLQGVCSHGEDEKLSIPGLNYSEDTENSTRQSGGGFGPEDLAAENERLYQELHQRIDQAIKTTKDPAILFELNKLKQLVDDEFKLAFNVLNLLWKWEWGTTNNFLYKYQNSSVPPYLQTEESFHLMDAGLLSNVPYQSFLGDKRDIDLIIALDYSARSEPGAKVQIGLTLDRDYAAELKKPFPEIDEKILEEEKDWPKDCYVFEGKEKEPTIVLMPLFNRKNCKDKEEVKKEMDKYCTFHRPYSQDQIESLMETAKENMKRNKETLLREFKKAAERRRSR